MRKIKIILVNVLFIFVIGCSQISGFQVSRGMSDAQVEEEAQSGQMRNIK